MQARIFSQGHVYRSSNGEVHPWAYLPSGERINLYSNPTAFCIALGLNPDRQVTVTQAKQAVHTMLGAMSRANSSASNFTVGSSFRAHDENAPMGQREARFSMTHIDSALRYANATGDARPLEGYTDIVVGPDGHVAIDASGAGNHRSFNEVAVSLGFGKTPTHDADRGYGAAGNSRGFGAFAAAKAEMQQRDAAAQAWGHERAAENAATGNVIER